jgi:hypothetical protein
MGVRPVGVARGSVLKYFPAEGNRSDLVCERRGGRLARAALTLSRVVVSPRRISMMTFRHDVETMSEQLLFRH